MLALPAVDSLLLGGLLGQFSEQLVFEGVGSLEPPHYESVLLPALIDVG